MAFTYSKLAEVSVGSGGTSAIAFNNIPQNYTDLVIKLSIRHTRSLEYEDIKCSINGRSVATNWSFKAIYGYGSTAGSEGYSGNSSYSIVTGDTATANTFSNTEIYIPNYSTSTAKSISADSSTENNGSNAILYMASALFDSTTNIVSIEFTPAHTGTFMQHSTATLYGVKAEV